MAANVGVLRPKGLEIIVLVCKELLNHLTEAYAESWENFSIVINALLLFKRTYYEIQPMYWMMVVS